jgi:hypothetical protein
MSRPFRKWLMKVLGSILHSVSDPGKLVFFEKYAQGNGLVVFLVFC